MYVTMANIERIDSKFVLELYHHRENVEFPTSFFVLLLLLLLQFGFVVAISIRRNTAVKAVMM